MEQIRPISKQDTLLPALLEEVQKGCKDQAFSLSYDSSSD